MNPSKNVVVYSEYFYPMFCGVPMSSRNIARSLVELGHTVTVYTPMSCCGFDELSEGYNILRGKDWMKLKSSKVDLLIVNNGNFSTKGYLLGRWLNTKIVQWFQMTRAPRTNGKFKGVINECAERLLAESISAYVGVSALALQSRPWIPNKKIRKVIYNCGESIFSEIPVEVKHCEYDFIFVGRITEAKGITVLTRSICKLEESSIDCKILMVGDGDLRHEMQACLNDFKHVIVEFVGVKRSVELVDCYDKSRTLLFTTTTHAEGLPLVIAEAVMRSLKIISSDHPVAVEAIGNYADIYERDSSDQLANLMIKELKSSIKEKLELDHNSDAIKKFSFTTLKNNISVLLAEI
jgi:glycosyltransferase involved in cell wall biosynthesis